MKTFQIIHYKAISLVSIFLVFTLGAISTTTIEAQPSATKFFDSPVSNYTGVPSIGVPIYTVQDGDVAVPISINYHGGGIKVSDVPSRVGMGWHLNAGGYVSREVRGLPDDSEHGYWFETGGSDLATVLTDVGQIENFASNAVLEGIHYGYLVASDPYIDDDYDEFSENGIAGAFFYQEITDEILYRLFSIRNVLFTTDYLNIDYEQFCNFYGYNASEYADNNLITGISREQKIDFIKNVYSYGSEDFNGFDIQDAIEQVFLEGYLPNLSNYNKIQAGAQILVALQFPHFVTEKAVFSDYEMEAIVVGDLDGEADIYTYSFAGYSGKFTLNISQNQDFPNVIPIPLNGMKIEIDADEELSDEKGAFRGFKLTTPTGISAYFGLYEEDSQSIGSINNISNKGINYPPVLSQDSPPPTNPTNYKWNLSRLASPRGGQIDLEYEQEHYLYKQLVPTRHKVVVCEQDTDDNNGFDNFLDAMTGTDQQVAQTSENTIGPLPKWSQVYPTALETYYRKVEVKDARLRTINSSTEQITFVAGAIRGDLEVTEPIEGIFHAQALGHIQINSIYGPFNEGDNNVKGIKWKFKYTYFENESNFIGPVGDPINRRLKLEQVQQVSIKESSSGIPDKKINPYKFFYKSNHFPHRLSKAIDHWGYYNGKHDNQEYLVNVPPISISLSNGTILEVYGASDRKPNAAAMMQGTLNKIQFPTGATTEYGFEPHEYATFEQTPIAGDEIFTIQYNSSDFDISTPVSSTIFLSQADIGSGLCEINVSQADIDCEADNDWPLIETTLGVYKSVDGVAYEYIGEYNFDNVENDEGTRFRLNDLGLESEHYYEFKLHAGCSPATFKISEIIDYNLDFENHIAGGLRIKSIRQSESGEASDNDIIKTYTYESVEHEQMSSGISFGAPVYVYTTRGSVDTPVKTIKGFSNFQLGLDAGIKIMPTLSLTGGLTNQDHSVTLSGSINAAGGVGAVVSLNNMVIPIPIGSLPNNIQNEFILNGLMDDITAGANNIIASSPQALQTTLNTIGDYRVATGIVRLGISKALKSAYNSEGNYEWPRFLNYPSNYGFVQIGLSAPLMNFQVGLTHGAFQTSADFFNVNFVDQGIMPLNGYRGNHIGYRRVKEHFNGLGHNEYYYNIEQPAASKPMDYTRPIELPTPRVGVSLSDGTLRLTKTYNAAGKLVQETAIDAVVENVELGLVNTNIFAFAPCNPINAYTHRRRYSTKTGRYLPEKVTKWIDGLSTTTTYAYNNPFITSPTATWTINSNGDSLSTEIKYAHEMGNETLIAQNIIAQPLETKQYVNGVLQGGSLVEYDDFASAGYQPFRSSIIKADNTTYWTSEIENYDGFKQPSTVKFRGTDAPIELTWLSRGQLEKKEWQGWEQEWIYEQTAPLADIGVQSTNVPKTFIDFDGQETHYTYDALLRPTTVTARDGAMVSTTTYSTDLSKMKNLVNIANLPNITSIAFLDGFGRQQFSGTENYAPDQSNVVHGKREFDKYGRLTKSYLPINMGTTPLETELTAGGYYATTFYEKSPLSRPIKQIAPESSIATQMHYNSNSDGDGVKIIRPTETESGGYTYIAGTYKAGSLYKRTFVDETGRSTVIFTDKIGRKILVRRGKDRNDTYYVYDDKGNLTDIHTPQSVLNNVNSGSMTFNSGLDFHFEYDDLSRIKSKKVPGSDPTTYDYYPSKPSLLEYTTDANGNVFRYVYDEYERLVQIFLDDTEISSTTYNELNAPCAGGGNCGGQVQSTTIAIFDGMDINGSLTTIYDQYDEYGRPIQVFVENHLDGTDIYTYTYDMADRIREVYRIHNGIEEYTIQQEFNYDHMGRLTWHKINGVKVEENTYNYRDELLQVKHHVPTAENVSNPFVSQGYKYDIRGRLTSLFTLNTGQDLFPMGQGQPLPAACLNDEPNYGTEIKPGGAIFAMDFKYEANGNIAQTRWQALGKEIEYYEYEYDQLNRLKKADYGWWSDIGGKSQRLQSGLYNMEVEEYDANGNILSLNRWSGPEECDLFDCPKAVQIDDLGYAYNHLGQLTAVKDGGNELGFDQGIDNPEGFLYDNNGNQINDPHKGYTIQYNALDLPAHIPELGISWKYDASGRKLAEYSTTTERDYVDGILYKDGAIEAIQHAHGRITADGFYEYTLSDHLGNGRVYLRDKNQNGILEVPYDPYADPDAYTEAIQEEHYYPFGMPMQGNSILSTPDAIKSRFGFNGNEALEETGFSDFNARLYRADLGRFMNVDPLATDPSQVSISPYAFAWNDPVGLSDPSGLCPECDNMLPAVNVTASGSSGFLSSLGGFSAVSMSGVSSLEGMMSGGIGTYYNQNGDIFAQYGDSQNIFVADPNGSAILGSGFTTIQSFTKLDITREEFIAFAAVIDKESSGTKTESMVMGNIVMNFLAEGGSRSLKTLADIVLYKNSLVRGATQSNYTKFKSLPDSQKNSKYAVSSVINAIGFSQGIEGFKDYSNGADTWDGIDLVDTSKKNEHRNYIWSSDSQKVLQQYKRKVNGGIDVNSFTYRSEGYQIKATAIIGKTLYTNIQTGRGERKSNDKKFR